MSMFTLAISYLTTSNLPRFVNLTSQVLCNIVPIASDYFYHQTHLYLFHFGSASSFLLEQFLWSSPVAYWASTDLGSSSFSVIYFCLFILFVGFSRQESWGGLLFPSPLDHVWYVFDAFELYIPWWLTIFFGNLCTGIKKNKSSSFIRGRNPWFNSF